MTAACVPCGTHVGREQQPCFRCESFLDHRHVQFVNRRGQVVREGPLCASCADTLLIRGKPLYDALADVEAVS